MLLRYSIAVVTVAKRQKLRRACNELSMPERKAKQVVRVVIVIAGPACDKASWIRSYAVWSSLVASTALQITNVCSIPILITRKGIQE